MAKKINDCSATCIQGDLIVAEGVLKICVHPNKIFLVACMRPYKSTVLDNNQSLSVGWSVCKNFAFLAFLSSFCNTAPAQSHRTNVVMYTKPPLKWEGITSLSQLHTSSFCQYLGLQGQDWGLWGQNWGLWGQDLDL